MYNIEGERVKKEFQKRFDILFKGLSFVESSHSYYLHGQRIPISVSGVIKKFEKKEDWDAIAQRVADRDGCTKEEILSIWAAKNKRACDNGHKVHYYGEIYTGKEKPNQAKEAAIAKFYAEIPSRYYPIGRELRMYHKVYNYSGTADLLFYDLQDKVFIPADWKTNEDLFKNFKGKTLLSPFEDLLDNPFNYYQIQLSLYELLFQQLNLPVGDKWIIWLLPDGTYKRYVTQDLKYRLSQYFQAA